MTSSRCMPLALLFAFVLSVMNAHAVEMVDTLGNRLPLLRGGWHLWNPYQNVEPKQEARLEATLDELHDIDIPSPMPLPARPASPSTTNIVPGRCT